MTVETRQSAQPRFCTPRNPDRATLGHEVVTVIEMMGYTCMPWQRQVLDIALELDADGDLVYREVVLIVPRQSGKTVLLLALRVWRALRGAELWGKRQTTVYTAQTRNDAVKKFIDDELPVLKDSPFGPLFRERRALGKEGMLWENGSRHSVEPTTKKAGHGKSVDQAEIDEAFAVPDDRVESGLGPTMITRRSAQMWIVSAVGDDSDKTQPSEWLKAKVTAGRRRCEAIVDAVTAGREAPTFTSCYFEWSAAEEADPGDPETWWATMPALGFTQSEKAVRAEFENRPRDVFLRAYLCVWPGSRRHKRLIEEDVWRSPDHLELDPRGSHAQFVDPLTLAIDASPGSASAALVVSGRRADGAAQVEVLRHDVGTTWVPAVVARLVGAHRSMKVVMGAKSPAAALLPELETLGVDVDLVSFEDVMRAAEAFVVAFTTGGARHIGQSALDAAVDVATRRSYGDRFAFGRIDGDGDISPLNAASLALWRALHPDGGRPRVRFL